MRLTFKSRILRLLIPASFCVLLGCPRPAIPPQPPMVLLCPADYPSFSDDLDYAGLAKSMESSLAYLRRLPPDRTMRFGPDAYRVDHLIRSITDFANLAASKPSPEQLDALIKEQFLVYRASGSDAAGAVLFTGYYEPLLPGSLVQSKSFSVAIHSRPSDLVDIDLSLFAPDLRGRRLTGRVADQRVVPYSDRSQIRQRKNFNAIAPPIAWLRDEVDLFILQIQGSGRIALPNGDTMNVRFDSSNGKPYRSVGRLLIDRGAIKPGDMSMQAIRDYLIRHPDQAEAIMDHNPRYIFFQKTKGGPFGALGEPLTPLRSIAVDRSLFPSAALAFIHTPAPVVSDSGTISRWGRFNGFVLAQDTGSAIKGPGRVDLFWGHGPKAEVAAGHLKHTGQLYFLVRKMSPSALKTD